MTDTKIQWTQKVWNPVRGCRKVSPGCSNCYAERMAARFSGPEQPYRGLTSGGKWTGEARFIPEMLAAPLSWRKPSLVFVNSMSDLFHEDITEEQIAEVFGVMAVAANRFFDATRSMAHLGPHTFQILTKRAGRLSILGTSRFRALVSKAAYRIAMNRTDAGWLAQCISGVREYGNHCTLNEMWPLPNVHLGVSVETQAAANERIPLLLQCPAAVRWVSCEPLLEAVDLTVLSSEGDFLDSFRWADDEDGIDWVVCGGESGPNARPMHPDWARSLRDQCRDAGVPYWFKQWGGVHKKEAGNLLDGARYEMRPGDRWP